MKHNRIPASPSRRKRLARYRKAFQKGPSELPGPPRGRLAAVFVSFVLIAGGVYTLVGGGIAYRNYWGGTVFVPAAIAIGIFFLGLVLFRWPELNRRLTDKNGKPFVFPGSGEEWRKW